jgi:hypothetical protein
VFLVLLDREQDFDTCQLEVYNDAAATADILIADAGENLFGPVVDAVKAIEYPEAT